MTQPLHATVTIEVEVFDPQALWDKAIDLLRQDPFHHDDDALATIGRRDAPDIGACLQMLLDRSENLAGAEIESSSSEVFLDEEDD